MLKDIDLNKLRVFSYVFRSKSISGAADVLHLTPSAVSQTIKCLEDEVGVLLFQRVAKKLLPTPEANVLFQAFDRFHQNLSICLQGVRSKKTEINGHLRIGAPAEFGSREVVRIIGQLNHHKNISFSIHFDLPDRLMALLVDGQIDIAFCDYGNYLKRYKSIATWHVALVEEAILVASPTFYQKFVNGDHSFKHLSSLSHIDYRQDGGVLSLWYRHHFGKAPPLFNLRLVSNHVQAVISAVKDSVGLGFVPTRLIEYEIKKKQLIPISLSKKEYQNPIVLVQLKDKVPTLLEKVFVRLSTSAK